MYKTRIENEYNKHEAQRTNYSEFEKKTTIWVGKHFKPCDHGAGVGNDFDNSTSGIAWCAPNLKIISDHMQLTNGEEFKSPLSTLSTGANTNDNNSGPSRINS